MWRLIQDFFRQNWIVRGILALGWLSVLIMVTSAYVSIQDLLTAIPEASTEEIVAE